ncbi:hypothetical protein BCR34DRAFT_568124 [Clohesyomyces aquaticus]|uniref:Carboxymuconolactone decarboxylase-like domain-containing protein n=1 Tax=Clohesyomyces aquaticus TaxID=1231657 RepID=A0A1Y1ZH43_9PLEO|nr:hypothetical protein BCR34DRAFT_568124 [Clohesyomyces aquaticus]
MSQRFPANEAVPGHLQMLEEQLHQLQGKDLPFEWKGQNDALFGPYPALLHSPNVTPSFWGMAKVTFSPDSVKPRNRELAVLGMLSVISAPYVRHAHHLIALEHGITDEQYSTGLKGTVPEDLKWEGKMAYRLGNVLADLKGPLADEV